MKRILILAAALFTAASLSAQDPGSPVKRWDDGPLSWDDFTLNSDSLSAVPFLDYDWLARPVTTKTGNLKVTRMQTESIMNPVSSRINPDHRTPYTLLCQQVVFNYVELCRRELQNKLDFDQAGSFVSKLSPLYHDKVPVSVFQKKDFGLGINVGYGNEFRLGSAADYVRPFHGLEGGLDLSYKNIYLYWNLFFGLGGKNPQEIEHNGQTWKVGAAQLQSATELGLSVPIIDGPWIKLSPFAGAGYGFVEAAVGTNANGKKKTDSIKGPRFVAGVTLDIKYLRWLDLYGHDITYYATPVGKEKGYNERSVRLMAYVARTNLESPIGPSWSINFGLTYYTRNWDIR